MMIYYTQGTGCSLSSQYSLQESISNSTILQYCGTVQIPIEVECRETKFTIATTQYCSSDAFQFWGVAKIQFLKLSPEANTGS